MSAWVLFNEELKNKSEEELKIDLNKEIFINKRISYAIRIHSRMSKLRDRRERLVIRKKCLGDY